MVLPRTIDETSPLDPLLLLPLPAKLPASPGSQLQPIVSSLLTHLDSSSPGAGPSSYSIPLLSTQVRQTTRNSQVLLNAARAGAATARAQLDEADVELRGVEYERRRVDEEMELCGEYRAKYLDMDLMEREEFLRTTGEDVLGALPAADDDAYEHEVTMALLQSELEEVEKREKIVAQLTKDRDALIRAKKDIKLKFEAVDTYLHDYARTTSALASRLREVSKIPPPQLSELSSQSASEPKTESEDSPAPVS